MSTWQWLGVIYFLGCIIVASGYLLDLFFYALNYQITDIKKILQSILFLSISWPLWLIPIIILALVALVITPKKQLRQRFSS